MDNGSNEERAEGLKALRGITATSIKLRDIREGFKFVEFYLNAAAETIERLESKINVVIDSIEKEVKYD